MYASTIILHLWRTSRPHMAVVGRVANTEHFRNVLRHETQTLPHVLMLRIDESLYFANAKHIEDFVLCAAAERPQLRHLVLICSAINFIDASALETLTRPPLPGCTTRASNSISPKLKAQ